VCQFRSQFNPFSQQPNKLHSRVICLDKDCCEDFERDEDDHDYRMIYCPACRARKASENKYAIAPNRVNQQGEVSRFAGQEERQIAQAVLNMQPPPGHRLQSESINIDFGRGTMNIERTYEPEPTARSTGLGILNSWLGKPAT
jgi:hypothetical protein